MMLKLLSTSFENAASLGISEKENPSLELIVKVININEGRNKEIAERCKTLAQYSAFISKIREFEKERLPREEAVKKAVYYCRNHDILKEFLETNATEVLNMLMTEWNWDDALDVRYEEGREEGYTEKAEEIACKLLLHARPLSEISEVTGLSLETIEKLKSGL